MRITLLWFLIGLAISLWIYWFVNKSFLSAEIVDKAQKTYAMTGTIIYHNAEKDRWDGKESKNPVYTVQFIPTGVPEYMKLYDGPFYDEIKNRPINLWCIQWSGMDTLMFSQIIRITPYVQWWEYDWWLRSWVMTGWLYTRNNNKIIENKRHLGNNNLSGNIVTITLTRPIYTYKNIVPELPDAWRSGNCIADSEIESIELLY